MLIRLQKDDEKVYDAPKADNFGIGSQRRPIFSRGRGRMLKI
jgi:hypothetical protein